MDEREKKLFLFEQQLKIPIPFPSLESDMFIIYADYIESIISKRS